MLRRSLFKNWIRITPKSFYSESRINWNSYSIENDSETFKIPRNKIYSHNIKLPFKKKNKLLIFKKYNFFTHLGIMIN